MYVSKRKVVTFTFVTEKRKSSTYLNQNSVEIMVADINVEEEQIGSFFFLKIPSLFGISTLRNIRKKHGWDFTNFSLHIFPSLS